jgi:hypothetical protein
MKYALALFHRICHRTKASAPLAAEYKPKLQPGLMHEEIRTAILQLDGSVWGQIK